MKRIITYNLDEFSYQLTLKNLAAAWQWRSYKMLENAVKQAKSAANNLKREKKSD